MNILKELKDKIGSTPYVFFLLGLLSVTIAKNLDKGGTPRVICNWLAVGLLMSGVILAVLAFVNNKTTRSLAIGLFEGFASGTLASLLVGICYVVFSNLQSGFIPAWLLVGTPTGAWLGLVLAMFKPETEINWTKQISVWLSLFLLMLAVAVGLSSSLSDLATDLIPLPEGTRLIHLLWITNGYLVLLFILRGIQGKWAAKRWITRAAVLAILLAIPPLLLYYSWLKRYIRWDFTTRYFDFCGIMIFMFGWIALVSLVTIHKQRLDRS